MGSPVLGRSSSRVANRDAKKSVNIETIKTGVSIFGADAGCSRVPESAGRFLDMTNG